MLTLTAGARWAASATTRTPRACAMRAGRRHRRRRRQLARHPIAVTAGSMLITATIAVPASTTATAVQTSLSSMLNSATDASTALCYSRGGTHRHGRIAAGVAAVLHTATTPGATLHAAASSRAASALAHAATTCAQ